jgi:hypothetical protein
VGLFKTPKALCLYAKNVCTVTVDQLEIKSLLKVKKQK